jgi:hypothetical protein
MAGAAAPGDGGPPIANDDVEGRHVLVADAAEPPRGLAGGGLGGLAW